MSQGHRRARQLGVVPPTAPDLIRAGYREVKEWRAPKALWRLEDWVASRMEIEARRVSGRNPEVWT